MSEQTADVKIELLKLAMESHLRATEEIAARVQKLEATGVRGVGTASDPPDFRWPPELIPTEELLGMASVTVNSPRGDGWRTLVDRLVLRLSWTHEEMLRFKEQAEVNQNSQAAMLERAAATQLGLVCAQLNGMGLVAYGLRQREQELEKTLAAERELTQALTELRDELTKVIGEVVKERDEERSSAGLLRLRIAELENGIRNEIAHLGDIETIESDGCVIRLRALVE